MSRVLKTNQMSVIYLLLHQVQNGEENLVSIVLCVNCKSIVLQAVVNNLTLRCGVEAFTSNAVSIQTVEEVPMWSRLSEVAPHRRENFLQLQGNAPTVRSHNSWFQPCEIHKP